MSFVLGIGLAFETLSVLGFVYELHHFSRFGYRIHVVADVLLLGFALVVLAVAMVRRTEGALILGFCAAYAGGVLLAIRSFPLNYLRSDMLPVISWADTRLLAGLNPYGTMHVGSRVYDFPYLPGMLVAYLPAVALQIDQRWVNLLCLLGVVLLIYAASERRRRLDAALFLGLFLLSPFLQYRHDLYLEPHWLALTGSITLLQRRHFTWAAAIFGISMALYQLSWVIFPFLVLYAYRRGSWREALEDGLVALASMFVVVGPFLSSALRRIESNTVGQWSHLPHAIADPINLSYWITFIVPPPDLKWVQLVCMVAIFSYCVLAGRCRTLTDTLRWMSAALTLFVALNVLVDGYFYLTLLLLLMMYSCAACGVWPQREASAEEKRSADGPEGRSAGTAGLRDSPV